ncbi:MAG: ACT domain-containing protein [Bacteroidaceae bacterium]|jgi:ACT domain-containing protein|nr:ACT domain-containing protein [Bacteroidaceae bacterium]
MEKVIISVLGKDAVGIIANVCTYLASCNVNVNDISQTIIQGYFNMMMIVDVSGSSKKLGDIQADLDELGKRLGVQVKCQREEIFDKMHRI